MEKEKYSIIITLLCLCMAMGGCSKEEVAADTATGTLTLQLQLPPALTVEVGESKGRAISLADIQINDVWAVQYDANGNFKKSQYIIGESNIVKNDDSQYLVRVTTSGFFNEDSRFYILVNTGNGSLIPSSITETDLKKLTVDLTNGVSTNAVPVFLTAGPISFTQLAEEGQQADGDGVKAIITAPLSRPYAALKFTYNSKNPEKGKFAPTSLSLGNLPTKLTVHADGNSSITDFTSSEQSLTITGWTSGGSLNSVYIGENLRGFGSGKTFQEKNLPAKGPNGSLEKCTYAVLTGTYYYRTGGDASNGYTYTTNGITVSYKFYLGGSLLDDYNIIRNTLYTVTINIGGANSADIRLTVTNGNVSYFDEVEEVQPEYEVIL